MRNHVAPPLRQRTSGFLLRIEHLHPPACARAHPVFEKNIRVHAKDIRNSRHRVSTTRTRQTRWQYTTRADAHAQCGKGGIPDGAERLQQLRGRALTVCALCHGVWRSWQVPALPVSAACQPARPSLPNQQPRQGAHASRAVAPPCMPPAAGGRSATDNRRHGEVPSPTASVWGQGAPQVG